MARVRERFTVVDTEGRLLGVLVLGADWSTCGQVLARTGNRWGVAMGARHGS
jgi:hypothetical protein